MLSTIISITSSILFALFFAYRNRAQFLERNLLLDKKDEQAKKENRKWHKLQATIQLLFFLNIFLFSFFQPIWLDALLGMSLFWFFFDGTLNLLNGNKFLHIGSGFMGNVSQESLSIDGVFKKLFKTKAHIVMLLIKLLLIIIFIFLYNFI